MTSQLLVGGPLNRICYVNDDIGCNSPFFLTAAALSHEASGFSHHRSYQTNVLWLSSNIVN
jgi:hypothetical protein